jgi:hypothetical protein
MSHPYISAQDILSSDGKYPKREKAATPEIRDSAQILATRLNALFDDWDQEWHQPRPAISSGYRPPAANKAAGGAARSAHLEGRACDFIDLDGEFAKWCTAHTDLLEQHGLWMEDSQYTKSWCHLQSRPAKARIFKP